YGEQLAAFRKQIDDASARGEAAHAALHAGIGSEAQWFYHEGLRLRQKGDNKAAQRVWRNLIAAFREVKPEQPWVRLAEKELEKPSERAIAGDKRWATALASLEEARRFRDNGEREKADSIWQGLEELYRSDPSAGAIREEIERDRKN